MTALTVRWHGHAEPGTPVAVLLHGGTARRPSPGRARDPRYARMTPFAWAIRRRSARRIVVAQIHHAGGGWAPVTAEHTALAALLDSLPVARARICLLGHSSGGRAALAAATGCAGVVALAPWLTGSEPVAALQGSDVVVFHGDRDRVTDPQASARYVQRLSDGGVRARHVLIPGAGHAMLERPGRWHRQAADAVVAILGAKR